MVEWNDPRVVVAIYAAIVATVSFLWHIIIHVKSKTRKLKVDIIPQSAIYKDQLTGSFSPAIGIIKIQATNYTSDDIYIKNWYMQFNKKIEVMKKLTNSFECFDNSGEIKYPHQLKKGDVFSDICNVSSINNVLGKKVSPDCKIKICVSDTFGKIYKSKNITFKILLDLLETENISRERQMLAITSNKI